MKKQKGKKKEGPTKHAPGGALQCLQMFVWIGLGGVILPKARSKSVTTTARKLKNLFAFSLCIPRHRAVQAKQYQKRLAPIFLQLGTNRFVLFALTHSQTRIEGALNRQSFCFIQTGQIAPDQRQTYACTRKQPGLANGAPVL